MVRKERLMDYLDDYRYDHVKECIVVRNGADEAKEVYIEVVTRHRKNINVEDPLSSIPEDDHSRWILDIAIDAVKNMSEKSIDYLRRHRDVYKYHFGGAMGIRNKYIHNAKKHHYLMADDISTSVMREIFGIVGTVGGDSRKIVNFYKNTQVDELYREYFDSDKELFLKVEKMISSDKSMNVENASNILLEELRKIHDRNEFIQILKDRVKGWYVEVDGNEKMKTAPYWNYGFRAKEVLYPREANQFLCLLKLGIFDEFDRLALTSIDGCKKYIYENMGLSDEDTEFMARTVWEACSLKATDRWKRTDIQYLRLPKNANSGLYRKGIRTLGDIVRLNPKSISKIDGIIDEHIEKIKSVLTNIEVEWE